MLKSTVRTIILCCFTFTAIGCQSQTNRKMDSMFNDLIAWGPSLKTVSVSLSDDLLEPREVELFKDIDFSGLIMESIERKRSIGKGTSNMDIQIVDAQFHNRFTSSFNLFAKTRNFILAKTVISQNGDNVEFFVKSESEVDPAASQSDQARFLLELLIRKIMRHPKRKDLD